MQRFEYINFSSTFNKEAHKVHFIDGNTYDYAVDFDNLLNSLGEEGWELVSVVPLTESYKPWWLELSYTFTGGFVYYLKRKLTEGQLKIKEEKKQKLEYSKLEVEKLIEFYVSEGYQIKFQHKNRIIFGKGIEEVRFDYDNESGQWVEKK